MLIQNKKQLPPLDLIPKLIAVDTETIDGVNGIEGYSFAYVKDKKIKSFFVPVAYEFSEEESKKFFNINPEFAFSYLSKLCKNRRIIFHNAEFDLTVLEKNCGIKIDDDKFEDTMLLHWVFDTERKQGLKAIMKNEYGKEVLTYNEARTMGFEEFSKYADNDARFTLFLYVKMMAEAKKHPKAYEGYKKYELPLVRVLQAINHTTNYVRIDEPLLKKYCEMCNRELEQIHKVLKSKLGDINFGSTVQLGKALEGVGYKIERREPTAGMRKKAEAKGEEAIGNYQLDEKAINKLYKKHKGLIFDLLIYNRGIEKLNSTYVAPLYERLEKRDKGVYVLTGYDLMHTSARSGRLGGHNPNLQNQPRDRIVFKFGYLVLLKDLGILKNSVVYMDDDKFYGYCLLSKDFEALDEKEQKKYKELVANHSISNKTLKFLKEHDFESCSIDIRKLYIAMPGKVFVDADLSQIELRMIAHLSKDKRMCDAFRQGKDLHKATAENITQIGGVKTDRQDAKCVHPDSLVIINGKYQTIGSLPIGKEGEFLKVCNKLIYDGFENVPIMETYNGGIKNLYHVVTLRGIVTCTDEHQFLCSDGKLRSIKTGLKKGTGLKYVDMPVLGDFKYEPIKYKPFDGLPFVYILPNHNLAYVAGMIAGDGCKGNSHNICISHGHVSKIDSMDVSYKEWQKIICSSLEKVGFVCSCKDELVYFGSRNVLRFMEALDITNEWAKTFRVPNWVLQAGRESIFNYLAGLFDTDGSVSNSGILSVTTKDAIFAGQISSALGSLGIVSYIDASFNKTYKKYYYRIKLPVRYGLLFEAYLRHPGKVLKLKKSEKKILLRNNHVCEIIAAGKMPCMDLHIGSEDHLYLCSNLAVHNSLNFGLIYGLHWTGLVRNTGMKKAKAKQIWESYFVVYEGVKRFIDKVHVSARTSHYVQTIFGRRRNMEEMGINDFSDSRKAFMRRNNAENASVATVVSGSSRDLLTVGTINIHNDLVRTGECRIVVQVHDELLIECDEKKAEEIKEKIKYYMENGMPLSIPVLAEANISCTWRGAHG